MKFILATLGALAVTAAAASTPVDFTACGGMLTVDRIEGSQWPPVKGQHFSSTTYLKNASGQDVKFDGSWTVVSKWNGMNADSKAGTVCDDGFGDVKCGQALPNGGSLSIVNDGDFPASAPTGTYVVKTEVKDSQYNVLYCYSTSFKA